MSVDRPRRACSCQQAIDPAEIDVVLYYGSLWKDYPVWQAAPWIAHRLGCVNAYAPRVRERLLRHACRAPALRATSSRAEPDLGNVLDRGGRPRVASPRLRERTLPLHVQLRRRRGRRAADAAPTTSMLGCHALTDGSFSLQAQVPPAAGSSPRRRRASRVTATSWTSPTRRDEGRPRRITACRTSSPPPLARLSARVRNWRMCPTSAASTEALDARRRSSTRSAARAPRAYLDDTGHMSGVYAVNFSIAPCGTATSPTATGSSCWPRVPATRGRRIAVLLAAGTGYTPGSSHRHTIGGVSDTRGLIGKFELGPTGCASTSPRSGSTRSRTRPTVISGFHADPATGRRTARSAPTIAPSGYLTLFAVRAARRRASPRALADFPPSSMGINYGTNKVRLPAPVPLGLADPGPRHRGLRRRGLPAASRRSS